jgi:hypothetical protein
MSCSTINMGTHVINIGGMANISIFTRIVVYRT